MKISIVLGTRPKIIKVSPIIRLCERLALDYFVLHTGQHYSYTMDRVFFEQLESNARLVLTDSGGVQEEACILGVPCVTLRDNTERPETLEIGANVLAGTNPCEIVDKAKLMLDSRSCWENPFGDGEAGRRIVQLLMEKIA